MRKLLKFIIGLPLLLLAACDVHEFPVAPETVNFHLRLNYETEMTEWKHSYDGTSVVEQGQGKTYDNHLANGRIRYIVRAYPAQDKLRTAQNATAEFVFTKDIAEGYDHEVTLALPPGDYNIRVWSDLQQTDNNTYLYNTDNFASIMLQGNHQSNTNYRDAFRGSSNISLVSDIMERVPETYEITMQRPLAKFEFVTNDVAEFIEKESTRVAAEANGESNLPSIDVSTRAVNIEDYKVVFYYVGFMPCAYSIYTDKPVDSSTGVLFESTLKELSASEASMGFDYVFVNGTKSAVTVQIGLYDNEGLQLSMSEPIEVPLKRSHHTIMTGTFLLLDASGGVAINPEFDGEYNLIFP